jgi:F-type H+-transporting ATPase subunit epsilon
MDDKLQFDLVSPERLVISERVDSVTIPSVEGDFGVLPNHSPVMAMIREGELIVENDGTQRSFALSGGFADVTPEGVTVLAEAISTPDVGSTD